MVTFKRLKIKIYKFLAILFLIDLCCKPDSKPVWLAKWWDNLTMKIGSHYHRKAGTAKRHNSLVIRFRFASFCVISKMKTYRVSTYEQFFRFYMKNHEKGIIFDVKESREYKPDIPREYDKELFATWNTT
jgi:hypothetical protein